LNSGRALLVFVVSTAAFPSWAQRTELRGPVPVELRHVGDDVLSERFADAVDMAFGAAADFRVNGSREPGTLVVRIPTNILAKPVGKRIRARYSVEFSSTDGRVLGARTGSCWDDNLAECAAQILKAARSAAHHVR
jgi:hypothetical protein